MGGEVIPLGEKLAKLKSAYSKEDEEKVNEILEDLEDEYHVDLTEFYGEDFDSRRMKDLKDKIKKQGSR
jgi:hypothetical protein